LTVGWIVRIELLVASLANVVPVIHFAGVPQVSAFND